MPYTRYLCSKTDLEFCFSNTFQMLHHFNISWQEGTHPLPATLPFLKALQDSLSQKIDFLYVVLLQKNRVMGFAVAQQLVLQGSDFNTKALALPQWLPIEKVLKKRSYRIWVIGNLFCIGPYGFTQNPESDICLKKSYTALDTALKKASTVLNSKSPRLYLYKDFFPVNTTSTFTPEIGILKQLGYRNFTINPNMMVHLNPSWKNYDDYLAALRTKYRSRIKTIEQQSKQLLCKDFSWQDIETHASKIEYLYEHIMQRAYFKLSRFEIASFIKLKQNLKTKYVFSGYFLDDELVGFSSAFISPTYIEASHVGYQARENKKQAIYQRILLDFIKRTIDHQKQQLYLGRSSETIKSTFGAQPVTMQLAIKHQNPIWGHLLSPLLERIKTSDKNIRNPFKRNLSAV